MKFAFTTLAGLTLVAGACAQGIFIASPPAGAKLHAGKKVTVQVVRPNHILAATEVGIVLSINSCPNNVCPPADSQLGTILHNSPFDPEFHGPGQQYQNFTVTIPSGLTGPADLIATRFFVIGAGPSPTIGGANNLVTIV